MADDFGTLEFQERWRQGGFFDAVNKMKKPAGKASQSDMTRLNTRVMRDGIVEIRQAITKMQAALARVEFNINPGAAGMQIDSKTLERNIEAVGGWLATAMGGYVSLSYYLSEAGYNKVQQFVANQSSGTVHPSRLNAPHP